MPACRPRADRHAGGLRGAVRFESLWAAPARPRFGAARASSSFAATAAGPGSPSRLAKWAQVDTASAYRRLAPEFAGAARDLLLFAVAVVAAATFGTDDGLASFYWDLVAARSVAELFHPAAPRHLLPAGRRDPGDQLPCRPAAAGTRMAHGAARPHGPGRAARGAGAVFRRPLRARPEVGATRPGDPGRDARAGAGRRVHRPRPPARRRQRTAGANRALRDEELRRALDLSHRSPAARSAEEGARLLAAEWALDDRDAPRAIELLNALPLGVARRTHALRLKLQAARLGRQPQEALKTARLLVKHQGFSAVAARRGCSARSRSSRSTRSTRSISCAGSGSRSTRRIGATRSSPRAPRRRSRRSARTTTRALGCGRTGSGSPSSAPKTAARSPKRWQAASGIGAEWLPRALSWPRRRCLATAPSPGRRQRACRARPVGQGPVAARAGGQRRHPRDRGAAQGLDRPGLAGRARGRREPRRTLLRERRASGVKGRAATINELSGSGPVG